MPTSKRGWWNWAKTTSVEYLLRCSLSKIDSQHFWDLMDCLPENSIEDVEQEILKKVWQTYDLNTDTLFFDTTNFFTYIDTTNGRCSIAQRGKNKQKRYDLRQVGLALVVSREDFIPLLHHTYKGNMNDTRVFRNVMKKIKHRIISLGLEINKHTLVFDRGKNSKRNLAIVKELELHYVGALTPYNHQQLVREAVNNFQQVDIDGNPLDVFRDKRMIWEEERTVIVFISDKLKAGQIRGIYQALNKKERQLKELQEKLSNPKAKKRKKKDLLKQINKVIKGQFINGIIEWELEKVQNKPGKFQLKFAINYKKLQEVEDRLGFRIIMTNRHEWNTDAIIKAFHGQATIENAFKNLKNPYHLALKPQYHWTDQKIKVHYFICVLGYLLSTLIWREIKSKINLKCTLDSLLDVLNNIRLGTLLEESKTSGKMKAIYKLEEMTADENAIIEALQIKDYHNKRPRFKGFGVYN
jgi:transposase